MFNVQQMTGTHQGWLIVCLTASTLGCSGRVTTTESSQGPTDAQYVGSEPPVEAGDEVDAESGEAGDAGPSPLSCGGTWCGLVSDGLGGVIDCGPCPFDCATDTFEALHHVDTNVHNAVEPRLTREALYFLDAINAGHAIVQDSIRYEHATGHTIRINGFSPQYLVLEPWLLYSTVEGTFGSRTDGSETPIPLALPFGWSLYGMTHGGGTVAFVYGSLDDSSTSLFRADMADFGVSEVASLGSIPQETITRSLVASDARHHYFLEGTLDQTVSRIPREGGPIETVTVVEGSEQHGSAWLSIAGSDGRYLWYIEHTEARGSLVRIDTQTLEASKFLEDWDVTKAKLAGDRVIVQAAISPAEFWIGLIEGDGENVREVARYDGEKTFVSGWDVMGNCLYATRGDVATWPEQSRAGIYRIRIP